MRREVHLHNFFFSIGKIGTATILNQKKRLPNPDRKNSCELLKVQTLRVHVYYARFKELFLKIEAVLPRNNKFHTLEGWFNELRRCRYEGMHIILHSVIWLMRLYVYTGII